LGRLMVFAKTTLDKNCLVRLLYIKKSQALKSVKAPIIEALTRCVSVCA